MSRDSILEYSRVQTENTVISNSGADLDIDEDCDPGNINDMGRTIMAHQADALVKAFYASANPVTVPASRNVVRDDRGSLFICTAASIINIDYASGTDLGQSHLTFVKATTHDVNVRPNGLEQIDGLPAHVVPAGTTAVIASNGTGDPGTTTLNVVLQTAGSSLLENAVRYDAAQSKTSAEQGQARANIGGGILAGYRNKIINGDFTVNQRNGTKTPGVGVFGYDRWKGHASGLEQLVEGLEAREYTLSWTGGGTGTFDGTSGSSPIVKTVTAGNKTVIVPSTSTRVSLVPGNASAESDPFEPRPDSVEWALCLWYFERMRSVGQDTMFASGMSRTSTGCTAFLQYVRKRAIPTFVYTAASTYNWFHLNNVTGVTNIVANYGTTEISSRLDVEVGTHTPTVGFLRAASSSAYIDVDAEIF